MKQKIRNVKEYKKENIAKLQELTKTQSGLTDDEYANLFGSAENTIENAGINAHDVNANVLTDGTINTVTIAGSAVTGSDYDKPGHWRDKFDNFKKNMRTVLKMVLLRLIQRFRINIMAPWKARI